MLAYVIIHNSATYHTRPGICETEHKEIILLTSGCKKDLDK